MNEVNPRNDPFCLADLQNLRLRLLHLRMVELARYAKRSGHVVGADEIGIDPRDGKNGFDVFDRLDVLNLNHHQHVVVRSLHMLFKASAVAVRPGNPDTALAFGGIFNRLDHTLGILASVHHRDDDAPRPGVHDPARQRRIIFRQTDQGRRAAVFDRGKESRQFRKRDVAVLHVDRDPLKPRPGQDFRNGNMRGCDPGTKRDLMALEFVFDRVHWMLIFFEQLISRRN